MANWETVMVDTDQMEPGKFYEMQTNKDNATALIPVEASQEKTVSFAITNLELTADTPQNVNHGLGYKFVHVSVANADGDAVDVQVNYVDENNLTLTANTSVTVSGVVSI